MNEKKDAWTKKELSLRPGVRQLAQAVIEQWLKDGKPKKDYPQIKLWADIIGIKI